jgi:ATP-dependent protease Clp ATPase subunit
MPVYNNLPNFCDTIANMREVVRCSFCGKGNVAVAHLIESSDESIHICDQCVDVCTLILDEDAGTEEPRQPEMSKQTHQTFNTDLLCSFCGKAASDVHRLISSPGNAYPKAYICDQCVSASAATVATARREKLARGVRNPVARWILSIVNRGPAELHKMPLPR